MRRPPLSPRLAGLGTTIFAEMSTLAVETGAINLGQGFPDEDGPTEVSEAAIAAIRSGANQYPPGPGIEPLRVAIADHQKRFWGIDIDPGTEVLVTAGATEAVAASVLALCDPGDEILAFEPTYDSYSAVAAMAGARLRPVALHPPGYEADVAALAALVNERTRLLLLNTPHNPTGKVFTVGELEAIARVCVDHDLIAVTDEVYEHLVFDGEHRPLCTFPGMAERTLTISSAGKTFSFTGWKIGWVCGPDELVTAVRTAKQFLTYANGAPFQPAIAVGLGLGDDFYLQLATTLQAKRDVLCGGLRAAGFDVFVPQGTYFATVDIRSVGGDDGLEFCRSLPERCGVVAVPSSVFYENPSTGRHLVRFAFCKRTEVLTEAAERLAGLSAR
jgi:N-succinyldiaminopimelate aminotransferase